MIKKFNFLFVTMFGLGKVSLIPGTLGSFVTVLLLFFSFHIFKIPSNIILIILITIFSYSLIAIKYHTKESDNKDPREIIIDEFIGQSIPIYFYEISLGIDETSNQVILVYVISFFLFRFFDIFKPFPVSYFDKKHKNSFGVVMDDVCAGFYVVLSLICFMIIKKYI